MKKTKIFVSFLLCGAFSYVNIVANQKGIDYGIELRQKEGKGYYDNEYIPL